MMARETCSQCFYSFVPPDPPGQLYCQVYPPQYGGHVTNYAVADQVQAQTIFCDPPVRQERQGCRYFKPKGKKK